MGTTGPSISQKALPGAGLGCLLSQEGVLWTAWALGRSAELQSNGQEEQLLPAGWGWGRPPAPSPLREAPGRCCRDETGSRAMGLGGSRGGRSHQTLGREPAVSGQC